MNLHSIIYLSASTTIIPLSAFILYRRNYFPSPFFIYTVFAFLIEAIAVYLFYHSQNNMALYYLLTLVEAPLLIGSVNLFLHKQLPRKGIYGLICINTVAVCIDYFFLAGIHKFFSFSQTIESFILIGVSIFGLYDIMKHSTDFFIQKIPQFWLNAGILVYSVSTIFVFAMENFLRSEGSNLWVIQSVMNMVFNLLLSKSILCLRGQH